MLPGATLNGDQVRLPRSRAPVTMGCEEAVKHAGSSDESGSKGSIAARVFMGAGQFAPTHKERERERSRERSRERERQTETDRDRQRDGHRPTPTHSHTHTYPPTLRTSSPLNAAMVRPLSMGWREMGDVRR